jgi:2-oxoglutarate ferredoxin oxidoreductase subunit gamma
VVLCGYVLGKAAMLDGKNATHTQSYGSASRGGLTRSDVRIEEGEIHDLVNDELDLLVVLSQQSYDRFRRDLVPEGLLFYDSDLVHLEANGDENARGIQATDLAYKKFGRKIIANMVLLGFVNASVGVVSSASLTRTIKESVPRGTDDLNLAALELGQSLVQPRTREVLV